MAPQSLTPEQNVIVIMYALGVPHFLVFDQTKNDKYVNHSKANVAFSF